jgi:hypothetical protein
MPAMLGQLLPVRHLQGARIMKLKVLRIRFQGREFVLTSNMMSGPIATPEAYADGEASYAHLFKNGEIKRFGELIGTKDDIEVLGPSTVDINNAAEGIVNMFTHPSWERPCESD